MNGRKPPAAMESREPHSIRFTDTEWTSIETAAREGGVEPSRFARQMCLMGLSMHRVQQSMREYGRATA